MSIVKYEFAGFSFTLTQGLFFKGHHIALAPKLREILDILLSCEGREISKDDLIARGWPDVAIADTSLYRCIYLLRKALQHPDGIEIISTHYNQGLRIAVPVHKAPGALPSSASRLLQTSSIAALETWQQGREFMGRHGPTDIEMALKAFRKAVELDPDYFPAWLGQAKCHIVQAFRGYFPPREAGVLGLTAVQRALEIAPDDASALAARAWINGAIEWQFDRAFVELNRAANLDALNWTVRFHRAWILHVLERHSEALIDLRTALVLNPLAPAVHTLYAWVLFCTQLEGEALTYMKQAVLEMPQEDSLQMTLSVIASHLGHNRLAIKIGTRAVKSSQRLPIWLAHFAYVLANAGRAKEAQALLRELEAGSPVSAPASLLAPAYIALNRPEEALECLKRSYTQHCPWFLISRHDPRLKSITDNPKFLNLAGSIPIPKNLSKLPSDGATQTASGQRKPVRHFASSGCFLDWP